MGLIMIEISSVTMGVITNLPMNMVMVVIMTLVVILVLVMRVDVMRLVYGMSLVLTWSFANICKRHPFYIDVVRFC